MQTDAPEPESDLRWEQRQRRAVTLLLLLIPLAIPAGLFAPNFIALMTTEDPAPVLESSSDAPRVELDHEPLLYPRHFLQGVAPPPTHTAKLAKFLRPDPPLGASDLPEPDGRSLASEVPDPGPASGDPGDVDPSDPLEPSEFQEPAEHGLDDEWPTEFFIAELPTGSTGTPPPAVPEPGTGLLLGAGLVVLAARGRSRLRSGR